MNLICNLWHLKFLFSVPLIHGWIPQKVEAYSRDYPMDLLISEVVIAIKVSCSKVVQTLYVQLLFREKKIVKISYMGEGIFVLRDIPTQVLYDRINFDDPSWKPELIIPDIQIDQDYAQEVVLVDPKNRFSLYSPDVAASLFISEKYGVHLEDLTYIGTTSIVPQYKLSVFVEPTLKVWAVKQHCIAGV